MPDRIDLLPPRVEADGDDPTAVRVVIAAAADYLDAHPPLIDPRFEAPVPQCMTVGMLDGALRARLGPVFEQVKGHRRYATQTAIEQAARAALPPVTGTVAEYAAQLRAVAVPGTTSYTCCGRPMTRQGDVYVCSKCGGWVDPGYASVREAHTLRTAQAGACTSCGGRGGRTVDTSSGGVRRQHWETCTACGGNGKQGGGV